MSVPSNFTSEVLKPMDESEGEEESDNEGGVTVSMKNVGKGFPLSLKKIKQQQTEWWEEMFVEEHCTKCNWKMDRFGIRAIVLSGTGQA